MSDDKKASQEVLEKLHAAIAKTLIDRIESGEAKAADLAAAVKFLADNGVKNIPGDDKTKLKDDLKRLLPFKPAAQLADEDGLVN